MKERKRRKQRKTKANKINPMRKMKKKEMKKLSCLTARVVADTNNGLKERSAPQKIWQATQKQAKQTKLPHASVVFVGY